MKKKKVLAYCKKRADLPKRGINVSLRTLLKSVSPRTQGGPCNEDHKEDPITEKSTKDPITEKPKENIITEDPKKDSITKDPQRFKDPQ